MATTNETTEIVVKLKESDEMPGSPSSNDDVIEDEEQEEIFEVEKILEQRRKGKQRQFLVRWKGYGQSEDSWEPESNLGGAKDVLTAYLKEKEGEKTSSGKKGRPTSSGSKKEDEKKKTPVSAITAASSRASKRTTPTKADDESDVDDKSDKSDVEFTPKNKIRKTTRNGVISSQPTVSSQPKANGTPTHMEKAVARRQNISSNMRWIEDSSGSDSNDGDVQEIVINEESTSPANIRADSSADSKQKGSKTSSPNANLPASDTSSSGLKIKVAVKGDLPASSSLQTPASQEPTKEKKHKKSKKHGKEKDRTPSVHLAGSSAAHSATPLSFVGLHREKGSQQMSVIGIDKHSKRKVYTAEEASAADPASMAKYLMARLQTLLPFEFKMPEEEE